MKTNNDTQLVLYETPKHLKNIFEYGELHRDATISKMEIVVNRGFRGASTDIVDHYNLDAILSVGYRVNSKTRKAAPKKRTQW